MDGQRWMVIAGESPQAGGDCVVAIAFLASFLGDEPQSWHLDPACPLLGPFLPVTVTECTWPCQAEARREIHRPRPRSWRTAAGVPHPASRCRGLGSLWDQETVFWRQCDTVTCIEWICCDECWGNKAITEADVCLDT
jgi:hypothetical protein